LEARAGPARASLAIHAERNEEKKKKKKMRENGEGGRQAQASAITSIRPHSFDRFPASHEPSRSRVVL
jgi:hypothetical protein